jgi:hypothetical protein
MIAAAFLFAVWFSVTNIHHDCTGDDCPVCMLVHHFSDILRKLGIVLMMLAAALFTVLTALNGVLMRRSFEGAGMNTPVSLKVQLNN